MTDRETAVKIAEEAAKEGGKVYYVGGYVRDILMGKKPDEVTDIDIEVHGIPHETLEKILDTFGNRLEIGNSFGIYNLEGCGLDIAMPRTERNTGFGHRDFTVFTDPYIGTYEAAKRRDFTVNAIMMDVLTGEIIDHFGGVEDIKNKRLKYVSKDTFPEDPLRVLRGAQFGARLGFDPDDDTIALFRTIDLTHLSRERVMGELSKALLLGERPSVFFEILRKSEALLPWFREVSDLCGIPQPVKYHSEGDVWNHTMRVLDYGATLREEATYKLPFMFAALCHDFGKKISTEYESGKYHAFNHENTGIQLAKEFISNLSGEKFLNNYVLNMIQLHMMPNRYAHDNSSEKATNNLFYQSVCPEDLILLALSDYGGSEILNEAGIYDKNAIENLILHHKNFLRDRLEVYNRTLSSYKITGEDLIAAGFKPGPEFKTIICYADKMKLSGHTKKEVLTEIKAKFR